MVNARGQGLGYMSYTMSSHTSHKVTDQDVYHVGTQLATIKKKEVSETNQSASHCLTPEQTCEHKSRILES